MLPIVLIAKVWLMIFFFVKFLVAILEYEENGIWNLFWASIQLSAYDSTG